MIGCLRTRARKQPIIALYFEFEMELKFYTSRPHLALLSTDSNQETSPHDWENCRLRHTASTQTKFICYNGTSLYAHYLQFCMKFPRFFLIISVLLEHLFWRRLLHVMGVQYPRRDTLAPTVSPTSVTLPQMILMDQSSTSLMVYMAAILALDQNAVFKMAVTIDQHSLCR